MSANGDPAYTGSASRKELLSAPVYDGTGVASDATLASERLGPARAVSAYLADGRPWPDERRPVEGEPAFDGEGGRVMWLGGVWKPMPLTTEQLDDLAREADQARAAAFRPAGYEPVRLGRDVVGGQIGSSFGQAVIPQDDQIDLLPEHHPRNKAVIGPHGHEFISRVKPREHRG